MIKKLAVNILESIGNSLWGFRPNLMKDIVEMHGGWKSMVWFAKNMPQYERILKKWGGIRTHALAVAISGLNGCPYCTYGHALGFQLHYFKTRNRLFPIDEREMMAFNTKSKGQIATILSKAYNTTNLIQEKKDLQRLLNLKDAPHRAAGEDDDRINQLVKIFNFLNICAIQNRTIPDFAHDPIQKNTALCIQYKRARASSI